VFYGFTDEELDFIINYDLFLNECHCVIICPARSINNMRINKEYKKPLKDDRLLFLSPFDENQRRISAKSSHYRNLFVAAMSAVIFVAHAGSGSKTEAFCKEIISWGKPIYTFDSDYNKKSYQNGCPAGNHGQCFPVGKFICNI
jgi:hypothetical protein